MRIDRRDGAVTLPDGTVIGPELTLEAFRQSELAARARGEPRASAGFLHYDLRCGQLEGKELLLTLTFHDGVLVEVQLTVDHYPPGPADWSRYSLDVEAAIKNHHDRLLLQQLGEPTRVLDFPVPRFTGAHATFDRTLRWELPWGTAQSCHDTKGGGTFMALRYGDGLRAADQAERRRDGA